MTVKDTTAMIAGMTPIRVPGDWVFCTVKRSDPTPADVFALIHEDEGTTLILPLSTATKQGFDASPVMALFTLQVHSDLEGVGLTAAVATALTHENIPCNVVAGYHHDHIFVPKAQADTALAALLAAQKAAQQNA